MKRVALFDVSALVYAGNAGDNPVMESKIANSNGLPMKGVRYALKKILGYLGRGYEVVAVMDSQTDKAKDFPDFKAQRTFNMDIHIQKEILQDVFGKFGITVLREDNYEADDLVYSYIWSNFSELEECLIVANDLDLCGAILDQRIRRVGITNDSPSVDVSNYRYTIKKGYTILYNTVLPFILFMGKPSNNLSPYPNSGVLYGTFCQWAVKNNLKPYTLSYEDVMKKFLRFAFTEGQITKDDVAALVQRMKVVYPRITQEFTLRQSKRDDAFVYTFCKTMGLMEFLSFFHIYSVPAYNKEFETFLQVWTSKYKSAGYAVSQGLPADTSFSSEFSDSTVPDLDNFNVGSF